MVSQLSMAGIQGGISCVVLKWFGEIIAFGDFGSKELWLIAFCVAVAVGSGIL